MNRLIEWVISSAMKHRLGVVIGALTLTVAGIWAFATITTDAFPDLTPNQVIVMTTARGLSPLEAEQELSYPMEVAMLGLPHTTEVRSISKEGLSVVTVTFEDDVDLYFARAQVQQRMFDAIPQLPPNAQAMLGPPATAMGEVMHYLVEMDTSLVGEAGATDTLPLIDLTNIQEYTVKPLLRTLPGVAGVNVWGGSPQQFQVNVNPTKLAGYRLTLNDVERVLNENNANFGGGYVEDRGERLTLRGIGRVVDADDISEVVLTTRNSVPIRVRDVASVEITTQPRYGAVSRDGRGEAVGGVVIMLKGSNGREVVKRVTEKMAEIESLLPPGVRLRPFYNQGNVVERTTKTVFRNLLEGALLVIAVLFLFLRNVRASLLTASVIPLALLAAFLAMKYFGISANLMSLGALDFGLIVDASVVMVENFVRRMHGAEAAQQDRNALLQRAAFEVGRPIVFGVAIIIAVYIPIFTLEGLEGRMFRPMAFTVCAAVLGSLLLALAYIPAMASYLFATPRGKTAAGAPSIVAANETHATGSAIPPVAGEDHENAKWFIALRSRYVRMLEWALGHRKIVIGASVATLAITVASVPFLGTEFMPKLDEGYLLLETRRIPSASLAQGVAMSAEVERTLKRFPEVLSVVTNLGRPQEATEAMALNQADVYVTFKPNPSGRTRSTDEMIPAIDSALGEIPGLDYEFSAPMAMRLDEVISGVKTQLGIKIFGDSLPLLQEKADAILAVVEGIRGAEDASIGISDGAMQLEVDVDRAATARYGLNVSDVRDAVESGIGGITATDVINGRKRYPVVVRLDSAYRSTPEAIGNVLLPTPDGGTVLLSQLARITAVEGPEVINHESGRRYVVVQSNVRGRDLGSFVDEVRREVDARVAIPDGYFLTYGGQFENQTRATERLAIIVPLVLLVIVALLYANFGTVRHALLVMLNVPFALVGGVAALWLRGINLNLSASVGFIALFGVAVLNGVVLIAYIGELRARGRTLYEAVRTGADVRFRPVLMTALVASVGFIPMAISTSSGSEVQRPLATVVIGGLVSSTFLTLLVLPTVYTWLEERAARRALR